MCAIVWVVYCYSVLYVIGIVLCGSLLYCAVPPCTLVFMLLWYILYVSWIGVLWYCGGVVLGCVLSFFIIMLLRECFGLCVLEFYCVVLFDCLCFMYYYSMRLIAVLLYWFYLLVLCVFGLLCYYVVMLLLVYCWIAVMVQCVMLLVLFCVLVIGGFFIIDVLCCYCFSCVFVWLGSYVDMMVWRIL